MQMCEDNNDKKAAIYIYMLEKSKSLSNVHVTGVGNRTDDGSNMKGATSTNTPGKITTGRSWHHMFQFHFN